MAVGSRAFGLVFLVVHLLFSSFSIASSLSSSSGKKAWLEVSEPSFGISESIGGYAAGCLRGGEELEAKGRGFEIDRPERRHHFGNARLIKYIREFAGKVADDRSVEGRFGPLLIGDLALPRGGPTLEAHASHQIGLDVDVAYRRSGVKSEDRKVVRYPERSVDESRFGEAEIRVLQIAASAPEVDRIFVNYAIKKELCTRFPNEAWHRKLRPWYGHDEHFHVRLSCAESDRLCRKMAPIPSGNGCDSSLAFWWSGKVRKEEALAARWEASGKFPDWPLPKLPRECGRVLVDRGKNRVDAERVAVSKTANPSGRAR